MHGNIMVLCFHVIKLHESIRFHVLSPIMLTSPPPNDVILNTLYHELGLLQKRQQLLHRYMFMSTDRLARRKAADWWG